MKKPVAIAFAAFLALFAGLELTTGLFSSWLSGPVLVAVLDTGVDARIPAIASRLSKKPTRNFYDASSDVNDENGHGTRVALTIAQGCGDTGCELMPLKLSKSGIGVTPKNVARAIEHAVAYGARVINVSFGLDEGAAELANAVAEAHRRGVTIVTAAGVGVKNPFRAQALSSTYPQAYPQVVVVGVSKTLSETDPLSNFGPELDTIVIGQTDDQFGSSLAAATVSGAIATALKRHTRLTPDELRQRLRAAARPPEPLWPGSALADVAGRLGFGAFDRERFTRETASSSSKVAALDLRSPDGAHLVSLGFIEPVKAASARFDCSTQVLSGLFSIEAVTKAKGRVEVKVQPLASGAAAVSATESDARRREALAQCPLELSVTLASGEKSGHSVKLAP